ncbi:MAG: DUF389 domain-containing protein [Acidobacteriota bacterium]
MTNEDKINSDDSAPSNINSWRDWFAGSLGVNRERKTEIYLDLSRSATLQDTSYWLQILFSSGIAILGMVLNSPAVVIGAMLISPLMGPILAGGLASASGDVILGWRAILNIVLSCSLAIGFAMLLVVLLPFKEVTNEIAARTSPNTLDLFIALFSGATGAIAVSKEVKGVATSIPGVAIAVALMPPLDAIGFGFGIAATSDSVQGLNIARGAGLLILTNLVAIMFSAMLVFLALRVNTESATEKVREWRKLDDESIWAKYFLARFPGFDKLRTIGSLPGRFLLILVPLVLISVPLYESFTQLKDEIVQKQEQNRVEDAAKKVWKESFAELPDGRQRGYVSSVETSNEDNKTLVQMNIFTGQPLSKDERNLYSQNLASRLDIEPEKLDLRLVEIPTTSSEFLAKTQKQARENIQSEADKIFTEKQKLLAAQIHEHSLSGIKDYFKKFELPAPAEFVNYKINMNGGGVPQVKIVYLSSQEIDGNQQIESADDVQSRLDDPAAKVSFERIEPLVGTVNFDSNQAKLSGAAISLLELTGQIIRQNPNLTVEISADKDENESNIMVEERMKSITDYLASKWQIAADRTISAAATDSRRGATLQIKLKKQMPISTDTEN